MQSLCWYTDWKRNSYCSSVTLHPSESIELVKGFREFEVCECSGAWGCCEPLNATASFHFCLHTCIGMLVFGIAGRVDLVGWVGVRALVEVVLARGGSCGRVVEFGRAVVFRCIARA